MKLLLKLYLDCITRVHNHKYASVIYNFELHNAAYYVWNILKICSEIQFGSFAFFIFVHIAYCNMLLFQVATLIILCPITDMTLRDITVVDCTYVIILSYDYRTMTHWYMSIWLSTLYDIKVDQKVLNPLLIWLKWKEKYMSELRES